MNITIGDDTYFIKNQNGKFPNEDIKNALKFIDGKFDTEKTGKFHDKNYGDYLYRSNKLELFLISTFNLKTEDFIIISFILDNKLFDIIKELPNYIYEYFNTIDLNLKLENKYNDEKWLILSIFTTIDGETASEKLDQLEDVLIEKFGDKFLDNILLSVEFE